MTDAPPAGINLGAPPPEGFEFFARVEDPGSQIATLFRLTDWTEPWLICLMMFHITLFAVNLTFRRNGLIQGTLFGVLLLLVYFSENMNEWAAANWKKFAGRQYFDSSGLFISVIFSIPSLFNCMVVVGNWLYQSSLLMVQVKQAQLKQQLKNAEARSKTAATKEKGIEGDVRQGQESVSEETVESSVTTTRRSTRSSRVSSVH